MADYKISKNDKSFSDNIVKTAIKKVLFISSLIIYVRQGSF